MHWFSRLFGRKLAETTTASRAAPTVSGTPPDEPSDPEGGLDIDVGAIWERMLNDLEVLKKHVGVASREELDQKLVEMDEALQGRAVRSAILDRHTCAACRSLDSKVVAIDSDEFNEFMPPKKCTAKECRCEYIVSSADQRS